MFGKNDQKWPFKFPKFVSNISDQTLRLNVPVNKLRDPDQLFLATLHSRNSGLSAYLEAYFEISFKTNLRRKKQLRIC